MNLIVRHTKVSKGSKLSVVITIERLKGTFFLVLSQYLENYDKWKLTFISEMILMIRPMKVFCGENCWTTPC